MPDMPADTACPGEGVCCPMATRCAPGEGEAVEVCDAQGAGWDVSQACAAGEVCEGARCVVVCEPGETVCRDAENVQTCDPEGASWTARRCTDGRCVDGECRTGALTSAECTADEQCAGGSCLCKADSGCPEGVLSGGYCSTDNCVVNGCEPAREICVDFSESGAFGGGSHCVRFCGDCPAGRGLRCRSLPVRQGEERVWADGCFADYPRDAGGRCSSDADCIGGTCWQGDQGPQDGQGYCTHACAAHEECPGNASCVRFPGVDGFFCGVHCGDGTPGSGSCPENRGVATRCNNLESVDGRGLKYICEPVTD